MEIPSIHLNGTSKEELIGQYRIAADAIFEAIHAVTLAAPNGRDYYPNGEDSFCRAQAEHRERLRLLDRLQEEFDTIITGILAQGE